jgi:hypothetical protein
VLLNDNSIRRMEMRQEFVQAETKEEAEHLCPWACKCIEVVGGYQCFESWADVEIWENQK